MGKPQTISQPLTASPRHDRELTGRELRYLFGSARQQALKSLIDNYNTHHQGTFRIPYVIRQITGDVIVQRDDLPGYLQEELDQHELDSGIPFIGGYSGHIPE